MTRFSPGFIKENPAATVLSNLVFQGTTKVVSTTLASLSMTTLGIGTAAADRWVFVLFNTRNSTARTLNSVTIGGVTAAVETLSGTHNQAQGQTGIAFANVPLGTTCDIVFNFSGAFTSATNNGVAIAFYTVNGNLNTSAVDTYNLNASTNPSKTFAVPAGGIAFFCSINSNAGATFTATGMNIDANKIGGMLAGLPFTAISVLSAVGVNGSFVGTGWSSGSNCPTIGRNYGHT